MSRLDEIAARLAAAQHREHRLAVFGDMELRNHAPADIAALLRVARAVEAMEAMEYDPDATLAKLRAAQISVYAAYHAAIDPDPMDSGPIPF